MNSNMELLDISFLQIKIFLTVVEEKSFSHAAVKLHMKQPTISKNISSMEQVLGVKVLTRSVRPVETTTEGKQLYTKWKNLLEEYEDSLA